MGDSPREGRSQPVFTSGSHGRIHREPSLGCLCGERKKNVGTWARQCPYCQLDPITPTAILTGSPKYAPVPEATQVFSPSPLAACWPGWSLHSNDMDGLASSGHCQWPELFLENDLQTFPFPHFQIKIPSCGTSQKIPL